MKRLMLVCVMILCLVPIMATCFAEETSEPVLESIPPTGSYSETEEMVLYPEALVPETPEGMSAYSIDGFVYFIWNDWVEVKKDDGQTIYQRSNSGDDTEGECIISYKDLSGREDGLTPSDAIGAVALGLLTGAPEDSAKVIPELTAFRGIDGILLTIGENSVMWLAQHKNAMVMVAFTDHAVSVAEMKSKLLQILGGSENEIKSVDME